MRAGGTVSDRGEWVAGGSNVRSVGGATGTTLTGAGATLPAAASDPLGNAAGFTLGGDEGICAGRTLCGEAGGVERAEAGSAGGDDLVTGGWLGGDDSGPRCCLLSNTWVASSSSHSMSTCGSKSSAREVDGAAGGPGCDWVDAGVDEGMPNRVAEDSLTAGIERTEGKGGLTDGGEGGTAAMPLCEGRTLAAGMAGTLGRTEGVGAGRRGTEPDGGGPDAGKPKMVFFGSALRSNCGSLR